VPGSGDDVTIGGGTTYAPTVDVASSIQSLTVNSSVTLTLSASLTVTNTLSISGGTLTFAGAGSASFSTTSTITSTGALVTGSGNTITFSGVLSVAGNISNYGVFHAGVSGTACTVNFSAGGINNQIGAFFYLGSTSVFNVSGAAAVYNNGTFTIQSDANGSGTIGPITGAAPFYNTYNVERYLSGGSSAYRSYRSLSSPVHAASETSNGNTFNVYSINYVAATAPTTGSGGTSGGFTQAGNPTFYLFRDNIAPSNTTFTSGNFRGVGNISSSPSYTIDNDGSGYYIPAGNGFLFFDRGDKTNISAKFTPGTSAESITLTATGKLNTGSVTVTPWFTPSSATLDYSSVTGNSSIIGYALVGNPYPSSIDWETYSASSNTAGIYAPNVGPTIYILNPLNLNYETYIQGNAGVGTYSDYANIIPSGQGFFVAALSSSASLTFNEAAKTNTQVSSANGNLFLGAPPKPLASQYLRIKMIKDSIQNDAILINFNSMAKSQYDFNEDAIYRPGSGAVSLSSRSADSVSLAINSLPLPKKAPLAIPLNVNAKTDGLYQLTMPAIKSIPALYDLWLMDAYKKDSLDFKHNRVYSFDIYKSDPASYGADRFSLVIRQNPALMIHLLSFRASKTQGGDQVVWTTENEQNYTNFMVERSTDGGTTFNELGGFPSSAEGTYSYLDQTPVNGANQYRLKIADLNGTVSYSKAVTIMYAGTNGDIAINDLMVYPNPVTSTIKLSIKSNQGVSNKPSYSIEIVNNLGSVVKSSQSSSPLWQSDVSTLTPGTYLIRVIDTGNNIVVGEGAFVKM
jgi:hypothetical protein